MSPLSSCTSACQKETSDTIIDSCEPLWVLGIELQTSGRAAHAPNCLSVSPALINWIFLTLGLLFQVAILHSYPKGPVDICPQVVRRIMLSRPC